MKGSKVVCMALIVMVLAIFKDSNAAPVIQKIHNKSQFGYAVVLHSDRSVCSFERLADNKPVVEVQKQFQHSFLIEPGEPSLVLRPVYYQDPKTNQVYSLVNDHNEYDMEKVDQAYHAWKGSSASWKAKKMKTADSWLHRWVGKDIKIVPHTTEILGYLMHISSIDIVNDVKSHKGWLSFSKGVFSRLMLELDIVQHERKGVAATLKVFHGEGGICKNGIVEIL